MNVYLQGTIRYCEECAPVMPWMREEGKELVGPVPDGGGVADYPQHCDYCGRFLENPLSDIGRQATLDTIAKHMTMDRYTVPREEWAPFYKLWPEGTA